MAETHLHPIPADTTVVEEVEEFGHRLARFTSRNHVAISYAAITVVSLVLHRSILRRELKRLHFIVEVLSDDNYGDYGLHLPDYDTGE